MSRWTERTELGWKRQAAGLGLSLTGGLLLMALVFLAFGVNPFSAFARIFGGSLGSPYGLGQTLGKAVPLLLIGLGLSLPFRGRFWNIGAEGQLLSGAIVTTALALGPLAGWPPFLAWPVLFLSAAAGGMLFGWIPVMLLNRFKVNEVISTLMLNYLAYEVTQYLVLGPMRGATQSGFPYSDNIVPELVLGRIPGTAAHWMTLLLAIGLVPLVGILGGKSKTGYEIRVLGENPDAARYAGIDHNHVRLVMMGISGALAGLAGAGEILGVHYHLASPVSITSNYGFTAIIAAWLGRLHPAGIVAASLFLGALLVGGDAIKIGLQLPAATVSVFQGILLLALLAGDFFTRYRYNRGEASA